MKLESATDAFACLSAPVRLQVFRLLVRAGRDGRVAGELAAALAMPPAHLSFHLKALVAADLASVIAEGRFLRYRANLRRMTDLIAFLSRECCVDEASARAPAGTPTSTSDTHHGPA